jgi:hypothetical protein
MPPHRALAAPLALSLALFAGPLAAQPASTPAPPSVPAPAGSPAATAPSLLEQADAHFHRGVELYGEGDYRAAAVEFQRAYAIAPSYRVLFDLAGCFLELQEYAASLRAFQRYLREGGDEVPAARRAEVEKQIERLELRVARVDLQAEAGAAIEIDDVPAGSTPLGGPLLLSAGRRKIVLTKPGRPPATKVVEVAGGDALRIPIEIPEAPPAAVVAGPAPPPPPVVAPPPRLPPPPIALWATTGVLLSGAAVTGVLALESSDDLKTKLATFGVRPEDISAASTRTRALALATDLAGGSAILMMGVSIYVTASRRPEPSGPGPDLRLGAGLGSIQATGRF